MNKKMLTININIIKNEIECIKKSIEYSNGETKVRLQAILDELTEELRWFEEKLKEVE